MPGATRSCPHCRATILESASVCPACRHHLRFDAAESAVAATPSLLVEGTLRSGEGEAVEYTMVLSVRNERGEEAIRHVVGVGALEPGQQRSFSVAVETRAVPAGRGRRR
jgi:hypothetical protein